MVQTTSRPIELDRDGDTGGKSCGQAKDQTEANAIANSENNRLRYRPCEQTQRTMLSAQQIIGKIKAAQHVKKSTRDAHGCYRVVVDQHLTIVHESRLTEKEFCLG
jgi:hypothetical protein